ncbi:MAG: 3-deoxy-D-manno-octulosonic acid transferase [Pseudomonadota bacterium]
MGADPDRFPERLGHASVPGQSGVIWFHAASLGEVMQIGTLAKTLAETTNVPILVTTSTPSGAEWVAREMPFAVHQFAPIDTAPAVARFLDTWSPRAAIFVEGDLWPRQLTECATRGIPQVLLNARHSRTRARFPKIFAALLGPFALITCRSKQVADGLLSLDLSSDRVRVLPDLKAASAQLPAPEDLRAPLAHTIGARPVWLAASTHPDDEGPVLDAHQQVLEQAADTLLIIAPRHPPRGAPLEEMAEARTLSTARRSAGGEITAETQIYIADTLGELGVFFSLAPVAFVGGSFGPEGGHTPYEPARFGTAIVTGPKTRNFDEAYAALIDCGAALKVDDSATLAEILLRLLRSETAREMGRAGEAFMDESDDGVARHVELLTDILVQ